MLNWLLGYFLLFIKPILGNKNFKPIIKAKNPEIFNVIFVNVSPFSVIYISKLPKEIKINPIKPEIYFNLSSPYLNKHYFYSTPKAVSFYQRLASNLSFNTIISVGGKWGTHCMYKSNYSCLMY